MLILFYSVNLRLSITIDSSLQTIEVSDSTNHRQLLITSPLLYPPPFLSIQLNKYLVGNTIFKYRK